MSNDKISSAESKNYTTVSNFGSVTENIENGYMIPEAMDVEVEEVDNSSSDEESYITAEDLKNYGFIDADIDRLLNGEVTISDLISEIENDTDTSRYESLMEASYFSAYGLEFSSLSEFESEINNLKSEINVENQTTKDAILEVLSNYGDGDDVQALIKIINGIDNDDLTLDDFNENQVVAWKYTDVYGNVQYTYSNPNDFLTSFLNGLSGNIDTNAYTEVTFKEMYGDSECLAEVREILSVSDEINVYQQVYDLIDSEVSYNLNNVHKYVVQEDFNENCSFNSDCLDVLDSIKEKYANAYDGTSYATITDTEEIVSVVSCILNDNMTSSYISGYPIESTDNIIEHYWSWKDLVTDEEVEVFNYIYNTEGAEAAYQYLKDIDEEIDTRWLAQKTQEDSEYASEHPVLASLASIVVTPIEGMSAIAYSLNSLITDEKILRTDVYSSGDVWRSAVSSDIAEDYGDGWAFVYSTGMSMADSATLIGLSALSGGLATPVLSAGIMGSRAYVSTLNDALDRGLDDGSAVALAGVSAIVETAMESYSVGHLLNLEGSLGQAATEITKKVASKIENETVANIATKGVYILASALSQGLAEGEEELCTEILNYGADILLAGDLSNYALSIENYLAEGYSEDEALLATMGDFSSQITTAFLGGLVSGVCFGAFSGTASTVRTSYGVSQQMYNDYYSESTLNSNSAVQFAEALEINKSQIDTLEEAQKVKDVDSLTEEQVNLLENGTVEMQAGAKLKESWRSRLTQARNNLQSLLTRGSSSSTSSELSSDLSGVASVSDATSDVSDAIGAPVTPSVGADASLTENIGASDNLSANMDVDNAASVQTRVSDADTESIADVANYDVRDAAVSDSESVSGVTNEFIAKIKNFIDNNSTLNSVQKKFCDVNLISRVVEITDVLTKIAEKDSVLLHFGEEDIESIICRCLNQNTDGNGSQDWHLDVMDTKYLSSKWRFFLYRELCFSLNKSSYSYFGSKKSSVIQLLACDDTISLNEIELLSNLNFSNEMLDDCVSDYYNLVCSECYDISFDQFYNVLKNIKESGSEGSYSSFMYFCNKLGIIDELDYLQYRLSGYSLFELKKADILNRVRQERNLEVDDNLFANFCNISSSDDFISAIHLDSTNVIGSICWEKKLSQAERGFFSRYHGMGTALLGAYDITNSIARGIYDLKIGSNGRLFVYYFTNYSRCTDILYPSTGSFSVVDYANYIKESKLMVEYISNKCMIGLAEDKTLYRSCNLSGVKGMFSNVDLSSCKSLDDYKEVLLQCIGDVARDNSFMSTSCYGYLRGEGLVEKNNVRLELNCVKGTKHADLFHTNINASEYEVVLAPGQSFTLDDVIIDEDGFLVLKMSNNIDNSSSDDGYAIDQIVDNAGITGEETLDELGKKLLSSYEEINLSVINNIDNISDLKEYLKGVADELHVSVDSIEQLKDYYFEVCKNVFYTYTANRSVSNSSYSETSYYKEKQQLQDLINVILGGGE